MKFKAKATASILAAALGLGMLFVSACSKDSPDRMASLSEKAGAQEYTGSQSCRDCHERFYQLWSTSHHGLAMQPYNDSLAADKLTAHSSEIAIGLYRYQAEIESGKGWIRESGPEGTKDLQIVHVLGGKNVFYFLTPWEKGRLQTLPLAYDVNRKEWFDTAASGIRHFPGMMPDEPLHWTDLEYTFNTSCFGCHVSQLETNYTLAEDAYHTTWAEPGINCETCHGPAQEHIRVCQEAPEGQVPEDLKMPVIMQNQGYSAHQVDTACVPCHAKMSPVTTSFMPGDEYFDHFDLVAFEHPDFYPDGRDLGENYTYTLWRMNPCSRSGQLDCMHCHTSSGRFRQKDNPNGACLPCHQERVAQVADHSYHAADSEGSQCIACHMPMTEFARMRRSDHSFFPPTPAATLRFESPNACNLCHADQDAAWANEWVRQWHGEDYQKGRLFIAGLIQDAREQDWERLSEMLSYIKSPDRDEIFATSLLRLLRNCPAPEIWPVFIQILRDPSPLLRSSAAVALEGYLTPGSVAALLAATKDRYRLVRIRAAGALAAVPSGSLDPSDQKALDAALHELERSFKSRPDSYSSHYNLANYYLERNEIDLAVASFEKALFFRPDGVPILTNAAMAYARKGNLPRAEASLEKALQLEPDNAVALFNLGLLKLELNDSTSGEKHLRAAFKSDPSMAPAAYNLGVLLAERSLSEAITWCRQASALQPHNPRYSYTLAFYLHQDKKEREALDLLHQIIKQQPAYIDAYLFLGDIYEGQKNWDAAEKLYTQGLQQPGLDQQSRMTLMAKLQALRTRKQDPTSSLRGPASIPLQN
jgi:tetratricopeptide (TPR) repeat protein